MLKALKTISFMMALMLCLPCAAGEEQRYICGEYEYRLLPDQTAEITSYLGHEYCIFIPDEVDGYPVKSIGEFAFSHDQGYLVHAFLPEGLESIGAGAFAYHVFLSHLMIPPSVKSIDSYQFLDCPNLILIVFPDTYGERYAEENHFSYLVADEILTPAEKEWIGVYMAAEEQPAPTGKERPTDFHAFFLHDHGIGVHVKRTGSIEIAMAGKWHIEEGELIFRSEMMGASGLPHAIPADPANEAAYLLLDDDTIVQRDANMETNIIYKRQK